MILGGAPGQSLSLNFNGQDGVKPHRNLLLEVILQRGLLVKKLPSQWPHRPQRRRLMLSSIPGMIFLARRKQLVIDKDVRHWLMSDLQEIELGKAGSYPESANWAKASRYLQQQDGSCALSLKGRYQAGQGKSFSIDILMGSSRDRDELANALAVYIGMVKKQGVLTFDDDQRELPPEEVRASSPEARQQHAIRKTRLFLSKSTRLHYLNCRQLRRWPLKALSCRVIINAQLRQMVLCGVSDRSKTPGKTYELTKDVTVAVDDSGAGGWRVVFGSAPAPTPQSPSSLSSTPVYGPGLRIRVGRMETDDPLSSLSWHVDLLMGTKEDSMSLLSALQDCREEVLEEEQEEEEEEEEEGLPSQHSNTTAWS